MSEILGPIIGISVLIIIGYNWITLLKDFGQNRFLQNYMFPSELYNRMKTIYPKMNRKYYDLATQALRQFFQAYKASRYHKIGLPSRVVADLWNIFSKNKEIYQAFCKKAFGQYMNVWEVSSFPEKGSNEEYDLSKTWRFCCLQDGIYRNQPSRLPLLFALDKKLKVEDAIDFQLERPSEPDFSGDSSGGSDSSDTYYVHGFSDHGHHNIGDSGSFGGDFGGFGDSGGGDGGGHGGH